MSYSKDGADSFWRAVFNATSDALFIHDAKSGQILDVNTRAEEVFEICRTDLDTLDVGSISLNEAPYTQEDAVAWMDKARTEGPQRFEWKARSTSGRVFDYEVSMQAQTIGEREFIIVAGHDITERKQAKTEIEDSREKYKALYENAPLSYQSLDEDGCFIDVNPAWLRTLGYERDEVIGAWFGDFLHPDHKPQFKVNFPLFKQQGYVTDMQYEIRHKTGTYKRIAFEGCIGYHPDGKFRQTYCVFTDITAEHEATKALKTSESRYEALLSSLPGMVYRCRNDADWTMEFLSEGCLELTGLHSKELLHNAKASYNDLVHPEHRNQIRDTIQKKVAAREPYEIEYLINTHDATEKWVWERGCGQYDEQGKLLYLEGFITDITERKVVAKELTESEKRFRQLFEQSAEAYFIIKNGRFINCNDAAVDMLGFDTKEQLLNIHPADLSPEKQPNGESSRALADSMVERMRTEKSMRFEWTHQRANGEVFPVDVFLTAITDTDGNHVIHASWRDITERKKAESEAHEARRQLQYIIDETHDTIFRIDLAGNYTYVNASAEDLTGYRVETLLEMNMVALIAPEYREMVNQRLKKRLDGILQQNTFSFELIHKNSQRIWVELTTSAVLNEAGKLTAIQGIVRNITERKRMQEAIEKRIIALTRPMDDLTDIDFDILFNLEEIQCIQDEFSAATGVASIITSPDGTPITKPSNFTPLCRDVIRGTNTGKANCMKSDSILGKYHPDGPIIQPCLSCGLWDAGASIHVGGKHVASWLIGQVRDERQTDEGMRAYAKKIGADEEVFMDAFYRVPVMSHDQFGKVAQALFTLANQLSNTAYHNVQQARFISEQQKAESELRRLSTAIEQSPETVVITDHDGIIQYVNPAFEKTTGYARIEAIGENPRILKSKEHDDLFYKTLWDTIQAGNVWEGRFNNRRKDGSHYTEEAVISPVKNADGIITNYVAVKRDISDELIREEEFRQAQKMEAVGQLAGGIAHDFNNILQGVLGFSEMLKHSLDEQSPEFEYSNEIFKAAGRAAGLTRQLLTFSRKQPVHHEKLDLNEVVHDTEALLDMLVGEKCSLILDLENDLPLVIADHGQVTQIIMNLAVNARDAMQSGGQLLISTDRLVLQEQDAALLKHARPGCFVCLSATDTGCGMDDHVVSKLFEPFFTTKEVGSGSGLGLSVVYGIVKQSKGWINVYSEPGKGSCFKIYLPAHTSERLNTDGQRIEPGSGNHARILIIEDDPEVEHMLMEVLKSERYLPMAASSAEEGLALFEKEEGRFDLLMSDMQLPGMRGDELADLLRERNPALPVLLFSGYRDQEYRWKNLQAKGYFFASKPFTLTGLTKNINDILSNKKA